MNRNEVPVNQKQVTTLKNQFEKYSRFRSGKLYLGFSKKKMKFILRGRRS